MFKYFSPLLGVTDIKKLYKELAKINHPDKSGGSLERMKEINTEYKTALALAQAKKKAYLTIKKKKKYQKKFTPADRINNSEIRILDLLGDAMQIFINDLKR